MIIITKHNKLIWSNIISFIIIIIFYALFLLIIKNKVLLYIDMVVESGS